MFLTLRKSLGFVFWKVASELTSPMKSSALDKSNAFDPSGFETKFINFYLDTHSNFYAFVKFDNSVKK